MYTTNHLIQLKVSLNGSDPLIWRRILVYDTITFFELHHIIQVCMGWENGHLFEFKALNHNIGLPNPDMENVIDSKTVTLGSVVTEPGEKLIYIYDFGDYWKHTVESEKILPIDRTRPYPVCLDGKMNCPPEDCGGIPGFYELLRILKDKRDPAYKDLREWAGRYNPGKFNVDSVNKGFRKIGQYILDWEKG